MALTPEEIKEIQDLRLHDNFNGHYRSGAGIMKKMILDVLAKAATPSASRDCKGLLDCTKEQIDNRECKCQKEITKTLTDAQDYFGAIKTASREEDSFDLKQYIDDVVSEFYFMYKKWKGYKDPPNDIAEFVNNYVNTHPFHIADTREEGKGEDFLKVLQNNWQAQIAGYFNVDKTVAQRAIRNAVIEEYKDLIAIYKERPPAPVSDAVEFVEWIDSKNYIFSKLDNHWYEESGEGVGNTEFLYNEFKQTQGGKK